MKKDYHYALQGSILLTCTIFFATCKTAVTYTSPTGYDFSRPEKLIMEKPLKEISGICFLMDNDESLLAVEDETGKIYQYRLAGGKLTKSKFGKKGDYEDVAIVNNQTASVLSSEGSIFMFAATDTGMEKIDSVKEFKNILPPGEYEGLFGVDSILYALCKDCPQDKPSKEVSVFALGEVADKGFGVTNTYTVDVSGIQPGEGKEKIKLHPSALARNPATNDWFVLSSTNKMLLQFDGQWKLKSFFNLDPSLFQQPEGMAFNSKGDLYISNEGDTGAANILIFRYVSK